MEALVRIPCVTTTSKHATCPLSAWGLVPSCNERHSSTKRDHLRASHIPLYQRRLLHTRRNASFTALATDAQAAVSKEFEKMASPSPFASLPLSTVLRSYLITFVSVYPILLKPSLASLAYLAHSRSPLLNPDKNPILRWILKKTFYAQFCAGETPIETRRTLDALRQCGYRGAILAHAKEVVLSAEELDGLNAEQIERQSETNAEDISEWEKNTLDTIELAQKDDFVALKFTGAGRQALSHLKNSIVCEKRFEDAVHRICRLSQERGVRLLFDAEQAWLQEGIDNWTLHFMKTYNKGERALVYGTYQAYAKRTPGLIAKHLQQAQEQNFVLGVKLVRGAYMGSDARELFWPNIEATHACYNGIAECMLKQRYGGPLSPVVPGSKFPRVNFVLASHNHESVKLAREIRDEQAQRGEPRIELAYGQLMGMADHVSGELVQTARARSNGQESDLDVPQAYKYLVWGTMGECMKYLVRRAQENKDAVTRTVEAKQALGKELARRFGLSR